MRNTSPVPDKINFNGLKMKEMYPVYHQTCNAAENGSKPGIVFFDFEADFVEDNVRCIPMIVRFKLDACGIKLKLHEWSKMTTEERNDLAEMPCSKAREILQYRNYLCRLITMRTGADATGLPVEGSPAWADINGLPAMLLESLAAFNWNVSLRQWSSLSNLQRFALVKLCKPGHENKNFPAAVKEFGLM
jgi:hypothetical protein